jgi:membrane protein
MGNKINIVTKPFQIKAVWKAMKTAAIDFNDDNGFKLAASLSYSMIFAIGPMLIVVISLAGIFWGQQAVEGRVYAQMKDLVGANAAIQIQDIIKNLQHNHHTVAGAIIGGVILVVTATGVFAEIQGSINYMWSILAKPKKGWLKLIMNRLLSFSLIVAFGFISMVALVVNSLMDLLSDFLKRYFSHATVYLFYFVNLALSFGAIILLFMIIFRILPDAILRWKDAFIGAVFTGVLFLLGKILIGLYIGNSTIGVLYGAAASIIIILTWVYYSSIILYYGAEFTKAYANIAGYGVKPSSTAVYIVKKESHEIDGELGSD